MHDNPVSNSGNYAFRVGAQLCDQKPGDAEGEPEYTEWMNMIKENEVIQWADWASDNNRYNPNYVKIHLETNTAYRIDNKDFRLHILVRNKNKGTDNIDQHGITPWASEYLQTKKYDGWSAWTFPENKKEFDEIRLGIEVKDSPGLQIGDVRFKIQCSEITMGTEGTVGYTPKASAGGGWSEYVTDSGDDTNEPDPDCVRIGLEVEPKTYTLYWTDQSYGRDCATRSAEIFVNDTVSISTAPYYSFDVWAGGMGKITVTGSFKEWRVDYGSVDFIGSSTSSSTKVRLTGKGGAKLVAVY
ncbi:MAG: hypothetical protein JW881_02195 [Spirochaetales bacterium]|nr:hypothetical protein [Spirochaetales bacterium]